MDAAEIRENRKAFDECARTKTPEMCILCDEEVIFIDETECWFSRDAGYDCPNAMPGTYGAHDV